MRQDTAGNDSLENRPLPKWLTDQRDGLNTYQPPKAEMKEDNSLYISVLLTGILIILAVIILTVWFIRKKDHE
jgi:heme/copper-type cytochrome/quinol oxidase subunit 2